MALTRNSLHLLERTNETENYWKKYQAMEESERNNQEKYFEESNKNVTFRAGKENKGQESGKPPVKNSRANIFNGGHDPLVLGPRLNQEPVSHMSRIVDTQSNGNDEEDTRDCVDRETPEMHEASNIDESKEDTADNDDGSSQVASKYQNGEENTCNSNCNISVNFPS